MFTHLLSRPICVILTAFISLAFAGCASRVKPLPLPGEIVAPEPIKGNSGKYMSPYTQDGVVAEWVDMAMTASAGKSIGTAVGAIGGRVIARKIPLLGGLLGGVVGSAIGKEVAIKAAGGWAKIKSTSDLSFNSPKTMAVYLYARHAGHADYSKALKCTCEIYSELGRVYQSAIRSAPRKVRSQAKKTTCTESGAHQVLASRASTAATAGKKGRR